MQRSSSEPSRCPKFAACSAPICPLDPDWSKRVMTGSDRTCLWLREAVKEGPEGGCIPVELRREVAEVLPSMLAQAGLAPLRVALKRAARYGSSIASGKALRAAA